MDCGHTYHSHCAKKWVLDSRTCPSCRKSVNAPKDERGDFSTARKFDNTSVDLLSSIKKLEKPKRVIDAPLPDIL